MWNCLSVSRAYYHTRSNCVVNQFKPDCVKIERPSDTGGSWQLAPEQGVKLECLQKDPRTGHIINTDPTGSSRIDGTTADGQSEQRSRVVRLNLAALESLYHASCH